MDSSLIASMPDMFLELDNKGKFVRYLGGGLSDPVLKPDDLLGCRVSDVWPVDAAKLMLRNVRRALSDRAEMRFDFELTSEGETWSYEARLIVRGFNRVLAILRHDRDSASPQQAGRDFGTDTVTGLPRPGAFHEQLEYMISDARLRERGLAVVCVDIDGFGALNKSLGRETGDEILRQTAVRIERYLRGSDTFSRLGSDEFVLVVADVDTREHADTITERVNESFAEPFVIDNHELFMTPSTGIALFPLDGDSGETLLANARVALNEARFQGKNSRQFYSNTMRFRANERLDDKEELRWAVEREQLELRYQPRVSLATGQVSGMEALLRWVHPIRGELAPERFIGLAEAGGLMPMLGQWAIQRAVADAARWRQAGHKIQVAVNLTESEFAHSELIDRTRHALEAAKIDGGALEFEITERMLMSHERAYVVTHKLQTLGVQLLVDQFGSGYSSASRLVRFPVRGIKLGVEMLAGIGESKEQESVCSALIAMAREMDWHIVAVGVENRSQLDFVRKRGCHAVQGHFLSRALLADEVPAYVVSVADDPLDDNVVAIPGGASSA